jgi:putative CocE/NonD family hydrolase
MSEATPITPGEVTEYEIDLWATSNLFKQGHRIRVEISSSNFPRFDRNPNTGELPGRSTEMVSALQTIHHSKEYPSRIVLPVINDPDGN